MAVIEAGVSNSGVSEKPPTPARSTASGRLAVTTTSLIGCAVCACAA
jgi:hypothetical protein